MKIFRLLFFSGLFLFLIVTGISLFIPSQIRISKAINIDATADSILTRIDDPAKWKDWFPGLESSTLLYENGIVKGVLIDDSSHHYIRIQEKKTDELIADLRAGSKVIRSGWKVIPFEGASRLTTVQWYMDFKLRWYPWEKFASLLFEKSYGARMDQGLINLKKLVETNRTSIN